MARGSREKDIKLLVAKFIKLVESLNPGERLSIRKVAARKRPTAKATAEATSKKSARSDAQRSQVKRRKP
jgi:hypothetical protein